MHNGPFWAAYIKETFIPHINLYKETIFKRLLPTFDLINEECEEYSEELLKRLNHSGGNEIEYFDILEKAQDAGIERYLILSEIKQGLLNLFTVGLYHLFEQQALLLLRREFLPINEENNHDLLKVVKFIEELHNIQVYPKKYHCWSAVQELQKIANAVKHGDGPSADWLKNVKPDLWESPFSEKGSVSQGKLRRVYSPLSGSDLYVTHDDLKKYFDAILGFWESLSNDLEKSDDD